MKRSRSIHEARLPAEVDRLLAQAEAYRHSVTQLIQQWRAQGIRAVREKHVEYGPSGGRFYRGFNGSQYTEPIRMSERQLREHDRGVLVGCVTNCEPPARKHIPRAPALRRDYHLLHGDIVW